MAAIITDDFRRNQARLLLNDIKASASDTYDSPASGPSNKDETAWPYRGNNRYSVGLGKSDPWADSSSGIDEDHVSFVPPSPDGAINESNDVLSNMIVLKDLAIGGAKLMIAKNAWVTGRKYKVYDPTDENMFYSTGDEYPCVVCYDFKVYVCLSNTAKAGFTSLSGSTVTPSATLEFGRSDPSSDGYVWAHVATHLSTDPLTTSEYVPISQNVTIPAFNQANMAGGLSHIGVIAQGTGYTSTPTVTLTLVKQDGTKFNSAAITATPVVVGGKVVRIDLRDTSVSPTSAGSYHYWASEFSPPTTMTMSNRLKSGTVTITGGNGSGAKAVPLILPPKGLAEVAEDILPCWFVGLNTQFDGTEADGDAATVKFRQVSLMKNFKNQGSTPDGDLKVLDALKFVTLGTASGAQLTARNAVSPGTVLYATDASAGGGSGAKIYFDYYDATTHKLYYHQNSNGEVNMIDPIAGDVVGTTDGGSDISGTGSEAIQSVSTGEYSDFDSVVADREGRNGEVIFHENRKAFQRSSGQTEEVKLIVQL